MRIVLDLQGCQSGSRTRGIGRYSWALADAMLRSGRSHEYWIALNGAFPESVESISRELRDMVPAERIVTWKSPGPLTTIRRENAWRAAAAAVLREEFLESLRPDFVHVSSLFEGARDDAVASVPAASERAPVAVTLYDLIPLSQRSHLTRVEDRDLYYEQLDSLRRADLLFAISDHTRREAIETLGIAADRIVNISSAVDARFRKVTLSAAEESSLRTRTGLVRPFVMFTGVPDPRKNVDGLIRAFASLPIEKRKKLQLAIVHDLPDEHRKRMHEAVRNAGLTEDEVVFTGFMSDEDLVALYNLCAVFVFPSKYEGFGLPVLEAMACGAPVITSNASSLPEVVGRDEAMFDPEDERAISALMLRVIEDEAFRSTLSAHGLARAKRFSWHESAGRALDAMEAARASCRLVDSGKPKQKPEKPRCALVDCAIRANTYRISETDLLQGLSSRYEVEVVTDRLELATSVPAWCPCRSHRWFECHADRYQRLLYDVTDPDSMDGTLDMLRRHPGVVLLQDVQVSPSAVTTSVGMERSGMVAAMFYRSHGYSPLIELRDGGEVDSMAEKYPCNWEIFEHSDGVIVLGTAEVEDLVRRYGNAVSDAVASLQTMPVSAATANTSSSAIDRRAQTNYCDPVAFATTLHGEIERFVAMGPPARIRRAVLRLKQRVGETEPELRDFELFAQALAETLPAKPTQRQLLVDVSTIAFEDAKTGIQRVVRGILLQWLGTPPPGWRVEPIYADDHGVYRYARAYTSGLLKLPYAPGPDEPIDVAAGDMFFGLDLAAHRIPAGKRRLLEMRRKGVRIHFLLYDMLPALHPEWFHASLVPHMDAWYRAIAEASDGVVAISRAVAMEYVDWLEATQPDRIRDLRISWAHIGADIAASHPTLGSDPRILRAIESWRGHRAFVMVGTIEPRKGHSQVLDAFEMLWAEGGEQRLVIVGKQGWHSEEIAERLRTHRENNKRLFWFEGVTDEMLNAIYAASSALLAASFGEGFGLPLIEAAQHGVPVLARNLPVFREVAGDAAAYFDAPDAPALCDAIKKWIEASVDENLPDISQLRPLTWAESAVRLFEAIDGKGPQMHWRANQGGQVETKACRSDEQEQRLECVLEGRSNRMGAP